MRSFSGKSSGTRMSEMRIGKLLLSLAFLAVLCFAAASCRPLLKDVFRPPKVRVADAALTSNPADDPKAPWNFTLTLAVDNPNGYALHVAYVAYTAVLGRQTVADGEHRSDIRIEPSGVTMVTVPFSVHPEAFQEVWRHVLSARRLDYEFNGSVGIRAPVAGVVRAPFSKAGTVDPKDILRKKGLGFK